MVFPHHKNDYKKLGSEDALMDALSGTPTGQYMFPRPDDMSDWKNADFQKKVEAGPLGILVIGPNGVMSRPWCKYE